MRDTFRCTFRPLHYQTREPPFLDRGAGAWPLGEAGCGSIPGRPGQGGPGRLPRCVGVPS